MKNFLTINYSLFLHGLFRCSEGSGSFFGTLGGAITDTDPTKSKYREQTKQPAEKPNFKTNPSKKGTGYGYI